MEFTGDQLAGIVDLFGALTQAECSKALAELAFKRGEEYDEGAFAHDISEAVNGYELVRVDTDLVDAATGLDDAPDVLLPGPVAFPELPDGARDLTHILDIETRTVDRDAAGTAVAARFREEADSAIDDGDEERQQALVDVSYELEAWASVDIEATRDALLDA